MVSGELLEWLPPGFTVKIKKNDGRKVKYYLNVATGKKYYSKNEVIRCGAENNSLPVTPQRKNDDGRPSSNLNADSISDKTQDSAAWLPSGWTVEERKRMSGLTQGIPYKIYTELSTGSKFYSKAAVTRYLNVIGHADTTTKQNMIGNVDEPLSDKSLQVLPMTYTSRTDEKKRKGNSLVKIDKVDEPIPEMLPQIIPITNTDDAHDQGRKGNSLVKIGNVGAPLPDSSPLVNSGTNTDGTVVKKRKGGSFVTVAVERTAADGLPSGWIKVIRISKSGNKTRKEPYYTDPVSGYMFRSKPDALRYLKTNDISSCACRPFKREDGIKLLENKNVIIPMTSTNDAHDQERKGNSLVKIGNVSEPLPDSSPLVNSGTNTDGTVVKKRKGRSFVTVAVERTTVDDLPSGWIKVIRTSKSGNRTRKEPYYADPVSGYMFLSKPDALRYLKTNDISSCACRPLKREDGIKLLENKNSIIPMTSTNDAHDQERKGNSLVKIGNVSEPLPDSSPLVNSGTNTDGTVVKKRKGRSFVTVAVERTTVDDLPSGWIKVIRTSKSGNRTRKEPYYADPVSGYMFLSKPDALRYLKTNDISSCACRPLKREDGIKLLENKNSSSNPATGKLSMEKSELFLCEGSNGGGESSGTKNPPDTDTKTLKRKQANNDNATFTPVGSLFLQEKVTSENSKKNAEMENFPQGENYVSKNDERAVAVDVALSSTPITGRGGRSNLGSRKSKKRTNSSLPLRASKRLAGSEPEIQSNMELKERSPRATVRGSTVHEVDTSPSFPLEASDIPQTSNIKPPKEPTYHTVRIEETLQDVNQLKEVEKPPTEGSPIPEPAPAVKESHNSKLCYDFGESWSDPLEFALKTLRGEIPIDDTLTFPSFFGDGCSSQTDSVAPGNFQSEQPSKKKNVDPSPTISSPLFSTLGNISFSSSVGVNFQPSTEVVKKDSQSQTKFHP